MSSPNAIVTREQLCKKINQLPQVDIGHFPTPLEECPRLSEALGGPRILIKREDCSGLAFGGNKVRQLPLQSAMESIRERTQSFKGPPRNQTIVGKLPPLRQNWG